MGVVMDKYILKMDRWHTPATDYPEEEYDGYRIHHSKYCRGMYEMNGIDDFVFFNVVKPIPITSLQQKIGNRWKCWMVDDPPHWRAMQIYAENSRGKVLTTGLGLGLIVHELIRNPEVTHIVVVEKSYEVIKLILPKLPETNKLTVLLCDFYDFLRIDRTPWDVVIVDLWVVHGADEKLDILYHRVLPMGAELRIQYPDAKIVFHGFSTVSDIQFARREMIDMIIDVKGKTG